MDCLASWLQLASTTFNCAVFDTPGITVNTMYCTGPGKQLAVLPLAVLPCQSSERLSTAVLEKKGRRGIASSTIVQLVGHRLMISKRIW